MHVIISVKPIKRIGGTMRDLKELVAFYGDRTVEEVLYLSKLMAADNKRRLV